MPAPIHYRTIVELGQAIRGSELSATAVAEHFLDRIDALEPRLRGVHGHLSRTCARTGARRGHAARGRHRPRSSARNSLCRQGPVRRGGPTHDRGHPSPRRQRAGHGLRRRRPADAGRDGAARQDDHGAVRVRRRRHQYRSGDPAQPLAPRAPPAGGIEFGDRSRSRCGPGADGAGIRYRRVGPNPREPVRGHRSEDHGRKDWSFRHLSVEPQPRQRGPVDPRLGRRRDRLRSDAGPRPRGFHDPGPDLPRRDQWDRPRCRRPDRRRAARGVLGRLRHRGRATGARSDCACRIPRCERGRHRVRAGGVGPPAQPAGARDRGGGLRRQSPPRRVELRRPRPHRGIPHREGPGTSPRTSTWQLCVPGRSCARRRCRRSTASMHCSVPP